MQLTVNQSLVTPERPAFQIDRPSRQERWAAWLSAIFSPPVSGVAGLLLVAASIATTEAWAWSLVAIAVAVALPCLFVVWLVRTGRVSDLDLRIRHQRKWPYRVAVLCAAIVAGLSLWFGAPRTLTTLMIAFAVQTVILSTITTVWKISLHSAAIAGVAVVALNLAGPATLLLAALVPVVAWTRIVLRRHDPAQTIAGAALGAFIYAAAFLLVPVV